MNLKYAQYSLLCLITMACTSKQHQEEGSSEEILIEDDPLKYPEESHFRNVRQLTFGGDNAEAYWSFNDHHLIFQSNYEQWGVSCDQIFYTTPASDDLENQKPKMISSGYGRTTCPYFMPGDSTILYASTHLEGDDCPDEPERTADRYVWPIYASYDILIADLEGNVIRQLTNTPGYDAEATVSPQGDKIVFTSMRTGDLELFVMDIDGSNVVQVTDEPGYDGGAFFSPDGQQLVFRASRFDTEESLGEYQQLLKDGLVEPTDLEVFVVNVDGSDMRQITHLGKANWAPYFLPSGDKIIFSSNHAGRRGFEFNLYIINVDGTGLEKVSNDSVFDSFPVFSRDGKRIVFSSNRNNNGTYDTNLFVAEWVD